MPAKGKKAKRPAGKPVWKAGYRSRVSAAVAHDAISAIRDANGGFMSRQDVVDASAPLEAPLHRCFEWQDALAANKWRCHQAGQIIRYLLIVREEPDGRASSGKREPRILHVHVPSEGGGSRYKTVEDALGNKEDREFVLRQALAALRGFRARYAFLDEMARVISAIDDVVGEHD